MKYLTKQYGDAMFWTNSKFREDRASEVLINGRKYIKTGKLQAVTMCAALYYLPDGPSDESEKYLLMIGYSKQNENDPKLDNEIAEEVAVENAMTKPVLVMRVSKYMREEDVRRIMRNYYNGSIHPTLHYVKTKEEIEKCI